MSDSTPLSSFPVDDQDNSGAPGEKLVDQLLDEQSLRWQRGDCFRVEAYLEQHPALRSDAEMTLTLIYHEVLLREERGETPELAEYQRRFPDLSAALRDQFQVHWAVKGPRPAPADSPATPRTEGQETPPMPGPAEDPDATHLSAGSPAAPATIPEAVRMGWPVIPDHDLLEELGRGGMGVVYKARQRKLKRMVALKMILPGSHVGAGELARFRGEAEAVARLHHPNLVQVYEVGEAEGQPFIALEFVAGGSLERKLNGTPLPSREAARLAEMLARAMHAAHQHNVVHRDLKPGNVLLAPSEAAHGFALATGRGKEDHFQPKITDFGLAKRLAGEPGITAPSELTQAGAIVGTPSYMAPEQARGNSKDVGPLADVYALGAILYETLTGRPPFKANTALATLLQLMANEPVAPRSLNSNVPRDLEIICVKCLHKDAGKRYVSAEAMAEDLRRFLNGEPIQARPVGRVERTWRWCRRKPVVAGLLAALLVASLGVLAGVSSAIHQSFKAEQARADSAEANAQRTMAEAVASKEKSRRQRADLERRQAELRERQGKSLPWAQRAALSRANHFHQAEALYLATALKYNDDPKLRAQLMDAMQRALVPLETSSRRLFVGAMTYSPDGKVLVTGDFIGGAIRVWRTDDWTQQHILKGHAVIPGQLDLPGISQVCGLAFHPNNPSELISVGRDGTIRVWDLARNKLVRTSAPATKGQLPALLALAVDPSREPPDGRRLVTGDALGKLKWWRLNNLQKMDEKAAHTGQVNAVCYRSDGRQVASTGSDGVVCLWDRNGNRLADLVLPGRKPAEAPIAMLSLVYSPDGRQLASGGEDGRIYVWDIAARELRHRLEGHEAGLKGRKWVRGLAYLRDGSLLSGGDDGTLREWDTRHGKQVAIRGRHTTNVFGNPRVFALAVRPYGREIASAGGDCAIRVREARTGKTVAQLEGGLVSGEERWLFGTGASAFCANKDILLTSSSLAVDAFLRSWDTRTLREQRTYGGLPKQKHFQESYRVAALAIHPDGQRFVSAEPDGKLVWWHTASGAILFTRPGHEPLTPAQQARLVERAGRDRQEVAAAARGELSWLTVTALAWSPDGKWLASAGVDQTIKVWDAESGKVVAQWPDEVLPEPLSAEMAIVTAARQQNKANDQVLALEGKIDVPSFVMLFDPAQGRLITAGRDRVIRVWDRDSRKVVQRLQGHAHRVNALALSGDGQRLASGSEDGLVILWDLPALPPVGACTVGLGASLRGTGPFSSTAALLAGRSDLMKPVPKHIKSLKPLRTPDLSHNPLLNEEEIEQLESRARSTDRVVRSLAFSPDKRWLAAVLQDGSVTLIDASSGAVAYRGLGHETDAVGKSVVTAYFTRFGELVTIGGDETVRHWELPAWSTGQSAVLPMEPSSAVARPKDTSGWVVLSGGSVVRWNERSGRLQAEWNNTDGAVKAVAGGRKDGNMVLATEEGLAFVVDLKSGGVVAQFKGRDGKRQPDKVLNWPEWQKRLARTGAWGISAVAVQPDGPLAASSWTDGTIDLWRVKDGGWVRTLKGNGQAVKALAFRPDGRQLAATYADGSLRLWDVASGRSRFPNLSGPRNAGGLCYSPDGRHLVQTGYSHTIAIWNPDTGQCIKKHTGHREIGLWKGSTGSRAAIVFCAAFSPDGRWLATGGSDGTVRLWDVAHHYQSVAVLSAVPIKAERQLAAVLKPIAGGEWGRQVYKAVHRVTFSADGQQLIAVLVDNEVRVYDLKPIRAHLDLPAGKLLTEMERLTGLRLQGTRPVPLQQNRLARPGETLRPGFQQDPYEFFFRLYKIGAYDHMWRLTSARIELEQMLAEPGVPKQFVEKVRTDLAAMYFNLGDMDRAEAQARRVLRSNSNNAQARNLQVGIYLQQARYPEALALLKKTLAEPGLLPQAESYARFLLALAHVLQGDLDEAEKELRHTLAGDRNNSFWRAVLGEIHCLQWRFAEGRTELERAIRKPGLPAQLQKTMRVAGVLPSIQQGARAFQAIVQNLARGYLAGLYLTMLETGKAEAVIQTMDVNNPGRESLRLALYVQRRQFARARQAFADGRHKPELALYLREMRLTIAAVYLETGAFDKAEVELNTILAVDKNNPWVLAQRAYLYAVQGKKLEESRSTLEKLVRRQPNNLDFLWKLGVVLARQGHGNRALVLLEKIATNEVMARNLIFCDDLGDVYHALKRREKARAAWKNALSLFPPTTAKTDRRKTNLEKKLRSLEK